MNEASHDEEVAKRREQRNGEVVVVDDFKMCVVHSYSCAWAGGGPKQANLSIKFKLFSSSLLVPSSPPISKVCINPCFSQCNEDKLLQSKESLLRSFLLMNLYCIPKFPSFPMPLGPS